MSDQKTLQKIVKHKRLYMRGKDGKLQHFPVGSRVSVTEEQFKRKRSWYTDSVTVEEIEEAKQGQPNKNNAKTSR